MCPEGLRIEETLLLDFILGVAGHGSDGGQSLAIAKPTK